MSRNEKTGITLASPPAIHVGPIVTPGTNETISIVIPLAAQMTTLAATPKLEKPCKDCGKDGKQSVGQSRPRHDKGNDGCPFPNCSRYGRAFSRAHDLKRHILRHEMRKEKLSDLKEQSAKANCTLCGVQFKNTDEERDHMKQHTVDILQVHTVFQKDNASPEKSTTDKDDDFLLEEMLLLNKNPRLSSATSKTRLRVDDGPAKIRCDYCSKTFKTKWTLSSHVAAHEGRYQFDCGQCGKRFVRKSHYEGHVRSHEAARPYVCEQCGKTFKELKHKREHVKRKHPSNQNAIQNLLDSISPCASEESPADQTKFTLLMPVNFTS